MKLEVNVPASGLDLASLEGEQGVFLSQNRGQNYITVAKLGHPITFGPMPIGQAVPEQVTSLGPSRGSSPKSATRLISLTFVAVLEKNPRKLFETIACNSSLRRKAFCARGLAIFPGVAAPKAFGAAKNKASVGQLAEASVLFERAKQEKEVNRR